MKMGCPDIRETRILLEIVEAYGSAYFWISVFHKKDLEYPSTWAGKLHMMQDRGYLKFKYSPYVSDGSPQEDMFKIDSMALTPEGETLLREHRERGPIGKTKRTLSTVGIAIATSVLTVVVMKLLGLTK